MPGEVQQVFGFALYQAQIGEVHPDAKPLKGFGSAGVVEIVEDWRGNAYRAVYRAIRRGGVRIALLPEEVKARGRDAEARIGFDSKETQESRGASKGGRAMRKANPVKSAYEELGFRDAGEMLLKAQLAMQISEILRKRGWSQQEAASVLGLTQPKLSRMLRGQFRGISEIKMMDCLVRLGREVTIVVGPKSKKTAARIEVVAA